ncbi:hypothetical protein ACFV46_12665 [Streptomyces sp. NPDC059852]|uniref:hypothetical protein n=1 Tax=Streptomyces sp. NPDC059852 TaxID=3346972 RepID=UPI003657A9A1
MDAAGAVVVLHGSASGVSATHRTVITQATTGVPGTPEESDGFGTSVASADLDRDGYADLDRDGYADLLVGTPSEAAGTLGGIGSLTLVWGGSAGLPRGWTRWRGDRGDSGRRAGWHSSPVPDLCPDGHTATLHAGSAHSPMTWTGRSHARAYVGIRR